MNKSEQIGELTKALAKCQAEVQGAIKDSTNPFFKSSYANLESCWAALKDPLSKNGLAVTQTMGYRPECGPTLFTTLLHESGQWISGEQPICPKSNTPQEVGSAISYARRYGLSAITGLIQVDDDGEAAEGRGDKKGTNSKSQEKPSENSSAPSGATTVGLISEKQAARLHAIKAKVGMPDIELKKLVKGIGGVDNTKDLHYKPYNEIVKRVEEWKPKQAPAISEEEIPF